MTVTCPQCGHIFEPALIVHNLAVCQNPDCVRTLVVTEKAVTVADSAALTGVPAGEIARLRQSRPKAWREATKARITEIRGR